MNNSDSNKTMMQYFHWYYPNDGSLWKRVKDQAETLAKIGITALWLPPAYKEWGVDMGMNYSPYDLYDLGEFDQQGSIRTKYGFKHEYEEAIEAAHNAGLHVYGDVVFNHKAGGDATEMVEAIRVAIRNRNRECGKKVTIEAATKFNFPGRNEKYSAFKWRSQHFNGTDWANNLPNEKAIYKFSGKEWNQNVDSERGNFDFLSCLNIDINNPEVHDELKNWGKWYLDTVPLDGFRLDAVKHIDYAYIKEWIESMREHTGKDLFAVGEYWTEELDGRLEEYIEKTQGKIALFDVPLHYNFHFASVAGHKYNLAKILDNTFVSKKPEFAVTYVENHDTQPLQKVRKPILEWFKPLAYALILLREGGYPCVFYPDYYGASYFRGLTAFMKSHKNILDKLISARKDYAYGPQHSYFDDRNFVGWTRLGDKEHPKAMAVTLSNAPFYQGSLYMDVERPNATFYDYTGNIKEKVCTDENGWGAFGVNPMSVSVWIEE